MTHWLIFQTSFLGTCQKSSHSWHCYLSQECIPRSRLCNGYTECRDMTDESAACSRYFDCYTNTVLEFNYFYSNLMSSSRIPQNLVPYLYVCDGIYDCINHSDEMNCNYFWNTYELVMLKFSYLLTLSQCKNQ